MTERMKGKNKVKCPKCGKEINSLHYGRYIIHKGMFNTDSKYMRREDIDTIKYTCPECGEVLFTNEDDAIEFLKGGKE